MIAAFLAVLCLNAHAPAARSSGAATPAAAPAAVPTKPVQAALTAAATEASIVLKVSDKEAVADSLIAKVEALGGYFSDRNEQNITFKIPHESEAAIEAHAATLGVVIDRQYQKFDLGFAIDQARSQLRSREEVMKRYLDVLADAGASQVVTVEREIVGLIQDIERQKGSLKQMEHRVRYAKVVVSFQFRERKAPARDGSSSFAWINGVNLSDLLGDFQYER